PLLLVGWYLLGLPVSEHIRRIFRVRGYVLAMSTRMLLLTQLLAVLTMLAKYCVSLRDYPRETAGWLVAAATPPLAISTFLPPTCPPRRSRRHVWLLAGVLGWAACLWWMSSFDNYTSKQHVALVVACWGMFLGLIPPSFLQDEIEALDRRDALYGGALAVVFLIVPIIVVPTMTGTIVSAWTDRAVDAERMNISENRPELQQASLRIADYYQQHGASGPELSHLTSTQLGAFVKLESVSQGIQTAFRFLSLFIGGAGLLIAALFAISP